MKLTQILSGKTVAGLALCGLVSGAMLSSGCQTYPAGAGGMTLPSGHYLKHFPQYFPPDPDFPLQKELNSMQDPQALARPGAGLTPDPVGAVPTVLPAPMPAGR